MQVKNISVKQTVNKDPKKKLCDSKCENEMKSNEKKNIGS